MNNRAFFLLGMARRNLLLLLVGVFVVFVLGFLFMGGDDADFQVDVETAARTEVVRDDLVVTLLQSGELQSKESTAILNETETTAKIVEVVEDGTRVEPGDLLVQLDAAQLQDRVMSQRTKVADAEANFQSEKEKQSIKELQFQTNLESKSLLVTFAKLDLQRYEEAEYPQEVRKAEMSIKLAEEELNRAQDELTWTRKLVEEGFANRSDLEASELEVQRKEIDLINKREDLRILQEYSHQKDLKKMRNDVREKEADLEQLQKMHSTEMASSSVTLQSKSTNLEIARNQLERMERQLDNATVYSDRGGVVFYPQDRRAPTIAKGETINPRQKILEFPDLTSWEIRVGVPESIIKQVDIGQEALATIDALPGEYLNAVVSKIGMVPDRQRWFDANSKTYTVTLNIPTTPTLPLKPGMSVMVEIVTGRLDDVLQVPMQAVRAEGEVHFAYRIDGSRVSPVEIQVGTHNETHIEVVDGLEKGDEVLLYAPVSPESRPGLQRSPLEQKEQSDAKQDESEAAGSD